jgi:hypothetical protein
LFQNRNASTLCLASETGIGSTGTPPAFPTTAQETPVFRSAVEERFQRRVAIQTQRGTNVVLKAPLFHVYLRPPIPDDMRARLFVSLILGDLENIERVIENPYRLTLQEPAVSLRFGQVLS